MKHLPNKTKNRLTAAATLSVALAAAIFAGVSSASAQTSITINNPSFQIGNILADGASTAGTVSGWTVNGNLLGLSVVNDAVGTFNPDAAAYTGANDNSASAGQPTGAAGNQVASFRATFLGVGIPALTGGNMYQQTASNLLANQSYVFTIAVGAPKNATFQGYRLSLYAGNVEVATTGNLTSVTNDAFVDRSLTYVSSASSPNLGQPLTVVVSAPDISLTVLGTAGVDFDNARLTVAPVPEPSTTAAVCGGLGLLGMVQHLRRRARGSVAGI